MRRIKMNRYPVTLASLFLLLLYVPDMGLGQTPVPPRNPVSGYCSTPPKESLEAALLEATDRREVKRVKALLQQKADPNTWNTQCKTPLRLAIEREQFARKKEMVPLLLAAGANPDADGYKYQPDNRFRDTILTMVIRNGDVSLVKALLKAGADVNAPTGNGTLPLTVAVEEGSWWGYSSPLVPLLLRYGADPNKVDQSGYGALAAAWEPHTLALLVKKGANLQRDGGIALIMAAYQGRLPAVKWLLAHGVPVDARNEGGITALMYAAMRGQVEIVLLLLSRGAAIHAVNQEGCTPLHFAVRVSDLKPAQHPPTTRFPEAGSREAHLKVVQILLDKGATINPVDSHGFTPLSWAKGDPELAKLLLKYGAEDPQAKK